MPSPSFNFLPPHSLRITSLAALSLGVALCTAKGADGMVLSEDFDGLVDQTEVEAGQTKLSYVRMGSAGEERGAIVASKPSALQDGSTALTLKSAPYSSTSNFVGIGANDLPASSIYTVSFQWKCLEAPDRTALFIMMGASEEVGQELFSEEQVLTTKGTNPQSIAEQSLFALRIGFVGQTGQLYSIGPDGNTVPAAGAFRFMPDEEYRVTIVANGTDDAIKAGKASVASKHAAVFANGELVAEIGIAASKPATAFRLFAQGDSVDRGAISLQIDNLRISQDASPEP